MYSKYFTTKVEGWSRYNVKVPQDVTDFTSLLL